MILNRTIGCRQCGLVLELENINDHQAAYCPRCHEQLTKKVNNHIDKILTCSITGIIIFFITLSFPFMSIEYKGLQQNIYLLDTVLYLVAYEYYYISLFLLISIIGLPLLFFMLLMALFIPIKNHRLQPRHRKLCRLVYMIQPWLMTDVFVIGILVTYVKINTIGDVTFHIGFLSFFLETIVLMYLFSIIDKENTWQYFELLPDTTNPTFDHSEKHIVCKHCHAPNIDQPTCWRCHGRITQLYPTLILNQSSALLLAAILLYFPANFLPIMITTSLGVSTGSTILAGVSSLWEYKSYLIAIIILVASIIIPMAKIVILFVLYIQSVKNHSVERKIILKQNFWFRLTHTIGRWSFIDIFVVALLVALIQLKSVASIAPGPAAIPFTAVVILTILSAQSFDTRLLWMSDYALKKE